MKILLAGSVFAEDSISTEIDGYLSKGHNVTVNTHYLSDENKKYLAEKYAQNKQIDFPRAGYKPSPLGGIALAE